MAIRRLTSAITVTGADQVLVNKDGVDQRVPLSQLPVSTAQEARLSEAEGLLLAEPPNVKDPVRDSGAVLDGATLITSELATALADAKQLSLGSLHVGIGGTVRLQVGVGLTGRQTASRTVNIIGQGVGHSVLRADYTDVVNIGEDAVLEMLDDGAQQSGVVVQQRLENFSIDGRIDREPAGHVRHGVWYKEPAEGNSDRAPSLMNLHILNCSGSALKIEGNDQVRATNIKAGSSGQYSLEMRGASDGKIGQCGFPPSKWGSVVENGASMKFTQIDAWLDGDFDPPAGEEYLFQFLSCATCVINDGEWEGPVLFTGDNHRSYGTGVGGPDSKFAFQVGQNTIQNINFKVSTDYYDAIGDNPLAHLTVKDLNGTKLPGCTFGYKLGFAPSGAELAATPDYLISIGTQLPGADANYAAALKNSGDVDVSDTSFVWHYAKRNASGVLVTKTYLTAKLHVCDRPWQLRGVRVGVPKVKQEDDLADNEIEMSGQSVTSYEYPLLYLFTEGGGTWARLLTDRDSGGGGSTVGYKTFTVPDYNGAFPLPAGWKWVCEFEQ